jgi:myo-inositol catabolism protein IolS
VEIIDRVPLTSGLLTGKYGPDVVFADNDHRSRLGREKIEWSARQADKLRELTAAGSRTMAQLALRFCLTNSTVSVVIPGAKTPEQLRQNVKASELGPLTDKELARIDRPVEIRP